MVVGVICFSLFRTIYKYKAIDKLIGLYPPFGECEVILVRNHSLVRGSHVSGDFNGADKIIRVAMNNSLKSIMDTYLHERRHSEQAFGDNLKLTSMYNGAVGFLTYMDAIPNRSSSERFSDYYDSEHEVDARNHAASTLKEYLAKN